jgi:hypothetical protein
MCVKKWIGCAILFYICYLIVNYLDKPVESFGRRGIGLRRGGYYGGRGIRYPVVVTQDYYPSYWYRYIPFFGY